MAIDTSIITGAQQFNPVQAIGQGIQLSNQLLQNQQLKQGLNSNKVISAAYQQATDPTTGQVDQNKLRAIISQSPDAAYNLPAIQGQLQQQQNAALEFQKNKFDLAVKQNQYLKNQFAPLAGQQDVSNDDLTRIAAGVVKDGIVPVEDVVRQLQNVPNTPEGRRQYVQQTYLQSLSNESQLNAISPQTQILNTGGQQQILKTAPLTGQTTVQGTINNTMDPGTASSPTSYFDPQSGTMRSVPRSQFVQMQGQNQPQGQLPQQGVPQQNQPYIPDTSGGPLGSGRLQPMAPPPVQQQQQAPGLQTAPALGSEVAANAVGAGAANASLSLQRQADLAPQSIYQFQNMRNALSDINTGPGTDWRNTAASFAQALAPEVAQKIGIDPQSIASREEFNKFATQAVQSTVGALGEGTDAKLASAYSANPNATLSKLGNQQIIDVMIAGQQGISAKNQAWQASGLPPEQYNKFSTNWNKTVDPRVFAAQNMNVADRYKMLDSLTPKEQASFKQSYITAHNAGYVQ